MKRAWLILIVSAFTDFIVTAITGILTSMTATGNAAMPNNVTLTVCILGGLLAGLRTIQQALKATPETAAALTGDTSTVTTNTVQKTP